MKHPLDIFQFLKMEHWYHKDGTGEIEACYKHIISGLGTERERRKIRGQFNAGGGYYDIKGYSESRL
jgi:hypothetical protein